MKSILFKAVIIPSLIITACKPGPERKTEIQYKIVAAKTKETSDSRLYYLIAFTDGYTESTSYGFYNCLQIGDSVKFHKDGWGVWRMKPKCKTKQ